MHKLRITFLPININFSKRKPQKQSQCPSFEAGLTPKMMQEIQSCDIAWISQKLARKRIPNDFKGNKVVAWCSEKMVEITDQLNERFSLKQSQPKGIYVEDFAELNVDNYYMTGFCNMRPTKLKKGSSEEMSPGTIFFNSFKTAYAQAEEKHRWLFDWSFVNEIAEHNFATRFSSTNHFLDPFAHEFSHVPHLYVLFKRLGGKTLAEEFDKATSKEQVQEYQRKYSTRILQICDYALESPFEAIACDRSRDITRCLDEQTLMPIENPFIGTPYEQLSFWQRINIPYYSDEQRPLSEILRNFWNWKFN